MISLPARIKKTRFSVCLLYVPSELEVLFSPPMVPRAYLFHAVVSMELFTFLPLMLNWEIGVGCEDCFYAHILNVDCACYDKDN